MRFTPYVPHVRALALQSLLGPLSWRRYQQLPALPPDLDERSGRTWPRVSIVVPARDEAARLPALLRSLRDLDYPDYAVIVVDDGSTDGTAAIAGVGGAQVVRGRPLPLGWTGKSFACHQGVEAADGALLLFTDADTVHEPASLRAAVSYLEREGLDALSLITGQRCGAFFERLLLPLAYAVLFAGLSPRRINGDRSPSPLANGQYMLYRRAAYTAAGGHSAVRDSLIEDAALARALSRAGLRYRLCRAESLVSVRMYGSLGELWAGFRKNAARYVLDDPRRLPATALYSTALGTALPLLVQTARRRDEMPATAVAWQTNADCGRVSGRRGVLIYALGAIVRARAKRSYGDANVVAPQRPSSAIWGPRARGGQSQVNAPYQHKSRSGRRRLIALILALANYLIGAVGLVPWYRRFGVPARYAALYPLAVGVFGLITADSLWRALGRRGTSWKGRSYR